MGFLAPMKPELRPLLRMLALERRDDTIAASDGAAVYGRDMGDRTVVATLTLIGTENARKATARLLRDHAPDHVVVVGIAGGVAPAVRLGDLVVPDVVIDASTGREFHAAPLGAARLAGRIRTSDDVNVVAAQLLADDIVACDMETAAVAAVCEEADVPWTAFRGISDLVGGPVNDDLLKLANPDGTGNLAAAARYLLPRPWKIPGLVKLARDTDAATKTAAAAAIDACGLAG